MHAISAGDLTSWKDEMSVEWSKRAKEGGSVHRRES